MCRNCVDLRSKTKENIVSCYFYYHYYVYHDSLYIVAIVWRSARGLFTYVIYSVLSFIYLLYKLSFYYHNLLRADDRGEGREGGREGGEIMPISNQSSQKGNKFWFEKCIF